MCGRPWNGGQRSYLAGGSDIHDVWNEDRGSGAVRSFVHLPDGVSIDRFISALLSGHSYASQGPLIVPEILFGSELNIKTGETLKLAYSLRSVHGLRRATLMERGEPIAEIDFDQQATAMAEPAEVSWLVSPERDTWYSIVVEDGEHRAAFSNPVWVVTAE